MSGPDSHPAGVGERPAGTSDAALAEDLRRGRLALARVAELEHELALARHAQDAKVAELERRLGWIEDHELDLRELARRRPWVGTCLEAWSGCVRLARHARRRLRD